MKLLAQIFLVFFVFFQVSSTVIALVETEEDTKISVLFDEDDQNKEETKEIKEFKAEFVYVTTFQLNKSDIDQLKEDNHGYILKDYSSYKNLFLLPPEQV